MSRFQPFDEFDARAFAGAHDGAMVAYEHNHAIVVDDCKVEVIHNDRDCSYIIVCNHHQDAVEIGEVVIRLLGTSLADHKVEALLSALVMAGEPGSCSL